MSDTDSFIDEVTEEVRRDRLYGMMRRYGWIAVLAVVGLVGGAAWNEWRKSEDRDAAEALGDGITAALEAENAAERATALNAVQAGDSEAGAVLALLRAAELQNAGQTAEAVVALDALAADGGAPQIYRDLAGFKALLLQANDLSIEERRLRLDALVQRGATLRLLAEEQLALIDIEAGTPEVALERLERINADSETGPGLRRRVSQLIVALGGDVENAAGTN